jgi:hypothetical protein
VSRPIPSGDPQIEFPGTPYAVGIAYGLCRCRQVADGLDGLCPVCRGLAYEAEDLLIAAKVALVRLRNVDPRGKDTDTYRMLATAIRAAEGRTA